MSEQDRNLVFESGHWQVHLGRRELLASGVPVPIGSRAFEIVELLVRSANELVTKDDLMGRIWPGTTVGDNTLQVHISAIRKAFGRDRAMLATASGRGYRLLGRWTSRWPEANVPPAIPVSPRAAAEPVRGNLPAAIEDLIGRDAALRRLSDLMSAYRIVTLTGPGGIGKTRLGLEVARMVSPGFDGGVWFVELTSLTDQALVATAIAGVLGVHLAGNDISPEALARAIGGKRLLLVMDNCEHIIEATARAAEAVIRLCPAASVLATSREPLRVHGEATYRVPPLDFPGQNETEASQSDVMETSAVQLFAARITAWQSGFQLQENASAIASVCRRLDGIPLAIEFAAARAATLGINEVLSRLDDRFALLTSGRRTALPKHRTLRATLDWSHELLSGPERLLLRRLAIFAAAFSLEAAITVTAGGEASPTVIPDDLANLVAKSLVAADSHRAVANFRLLETTRAYALEKLVESGEARELAQRHAAYYQTLLKKIVDDEDASTAYPADLGNARAALEWCFGNNGDAEIGVGLAVAAAPVFLAMSLLTECHHWSERAIHALGAAAHGGIPEMQLQAALGVSLMFTRGESEAVRLALERSLAIAEERGDARNQLRLLSTLHMFHGRNGDGKTSLEYAKRGSAVAGAIQDPAGLALAHSLLGLALHLNGDQSGARAELETALRHGPGSQRTSMIYVGLDGHSIAGVALARTLWLQGHPAQAVERARQSAEDAKRMDHPVTRSVVLIWAVTVFLWVGDLQSAEAHIDWFISRARAHSMGPYLAVGRAFKAQLAILDGEAATGVEVLRDCLEELHAAHYETLTIPFNISLVQGLMAIGRSAEGITLADETIRLAEANGAMCNMPELLRLKGRLVGSMPRADDDGAETYFMRSLELSRRQGARAWELRAATDLASVFASRGQADSAYALLRPVFEKFSEGLDTVDLVAAERLLAALGQVGSRFRIT